MRSFAILGATVIAAAGLAVACSDQSQQSDTARVREETREAAQATGDYLAQKKAEAQQRLESRLQDLEERIRSLRSQADQGGEKARQALNDAVDQLSQQQAKAEQALRDLGDATADTWQEVEDRAAAAVDELERAVDRTTSKLG